MDVPFVIDDSPESQEFQVEKKTGSVFKSYRARTVKFERDCLKCFSNKVYKEADFLLGAQIYVTPSSLEVKLKLKDKKEMTTYRLKTTPEMTQFIDCVRRTIRRANIQGIQNGSRDPEVVEWYFQYQSDVTKITAFLQEKQLVSMYHSLPGQDIVRRTQFHVTKSSDRSGLLFTLDSSDSDGSPPSRFASLYNGRIVPFTAITGAFLPNGKFDATVAGDEKADAGSPNSPSRVGGAPLSFILHTKEDELSLEIDYGGAKWLQAVQALCLFSTMPVPSSRSVSPAVPGSGDAAPLAGFAKNSGACFTISPEVALILQGLSSQPSPSRTLALFAEEVHAVFRGLAELRCNREAGIVLGERIEDIVRVLSEPSLANVTLTPEKRELFEPKIAALTMSLQAVRAYVKTQRHAGWLKANVDAAVPAKITYDALDADLMAIVNKLISAMALRNSLMFEKKEYTCAANVRKSVESLGGLEKIYSDTIKERSLAQLLQADGAEVRRELERLNGLMPSASQQSAATSVTEIEDGREAPPVRGCMQNCCYYLFCCCVYDCCAPKPSSAPKKAHVRTAQASLKEPLVDSA